MTLTAAQVNLILENPIEAARLANLVYITQNKLTIKRHRHGRGFYYTRKGEKIVDGNSLKRFKSLVIPPAWEDVHITHLENGHLQVVGFDDKKRKQYRYHPKWSLIRNRTKFFKMAAFGNALSQIRKQIEIDLSLKRMGKRKCLALILKLMEETHIRIGNDYYAQKNKSYGLTTLRNKHLDVYKNKVKFNFIGKKGKEHSITLKNKKLQRLVLQCHEIPGWELFQYYDHDGNHHSIDSGMVNDYIHEISGDLFSAKDFRTWAGSKIFFETLYHLGPANTSTEINKNILIAYDATSEGLGNTRTVCKKYYVHPILPSKYEDGSLDVYFEKLNNITETLPHLSSSEEVLLELLSQYKVEAHS